jgi:hypothetical protein
VTVNNVAPTVTLTGDATVNEGLTRTYSYTVTDPAGTVRRTETVRGCWQSERQVPDMEVAMAKEFQVTFDCADPGALAGFWAEALGYEFDAPPPGFDSWDAALGYLLARAVDEPLLLVLDEFPYLCEADPALPSTLQPGEGYTSLDLTVKFLRPVTSESGRLRAEGSVLQRGRRTALAQAQLFDGSGRLVAHATSSSRRTAGFSSRNSLLATGRISFAGQPMLQGSATQPVTPESVTFVIWGICVAETRVHSSIAGTPYARHPRGSIALGISRGCAYRSSTITGAESNRD